jgi:hypothetical protein
VPPLPNFAHGDQLTSAETSPYCATSLPSLTPMMRGSWLRCIRSAYRGAVSLSRRARVLMSRELAHSWDTEQYSRLPAFSAARIL